MNFTPDTYFNGDISSLLGKMEEQAISRESYTFPLCYSALNSVTSEKWNTTAKKPVNETVSHRQQYSYSSADKHHCVCVVCVLLCRSSKAAVLLFAVPSLQLNAPQDLLFQHNSIAFKQGKKKNKDRHIKAQPTTLTKNLTVFPAPSADILVHNKEYFMD